MWTWILKILSFIYSTWKDLSEEDKNKIINTITDLFDYIFRTYYRYYKNAKEKENEENWHDIWIFQ